MCEDLFLRLKSLKHMTIFCVGLQFKEHLVL